MTVMQDMLFQSDQQLDNEHDDTILFADDRHGGEEEKKSAPWKIIIADDEEEVHAMTRMVMKKFEFEGRAVELISAYSGKQTIEIMEKQPDVAIILLDVVMENENSGLEVVKKIRDELRNPFVRIILRTGQPGQAPEEDVIRNYDINDYKSKTELTVQKLYTAVIASLRAYQGMRIIETNRIGLERIINSSRDLFEMQSLRSFSKNAIMQMCQLIAHDETHEGEMSGLAATVRKNELIAIAGTGRFESYGGFLVKDIPDQGLQEDFEQAVSISGSYFRDNVFIGHFKSINNNESLFYIKSYRPFEDFEKNLLKILSSNVSVAIDNIYLNNEIVDTQKEVIFTLGEIVETRSKETANHVRRVAEYSWILARALGASSEEANILRLASPMHDIGKIGIPDLILNKPGKLTEEEFEVIKTHTEIGYEVLKQSNRRIMKTAATIALQHHERWDGNGYPYGIKGEEIDLFSRITSVCDVYDALSHKRIYKDAWPEEEVHEYFKSMRSQMFDPKVVDKLFEHIDDIIAIKEKYPD